MSHTHVMSSCSGSFGGCYGWIMAGSVRLLVGREKTIQNVNDHLANDLDMVHWNRPMRNWRSRSATSIRSGSPGTSATTTTLGISVTCVTRFFMPPLGTPGLFFRWTVFIWLHMTSEASLRWVRSCISLWRLTSTTCAECWRCGIQVLPRRCRLKEGLKELLTYPKKEKNQYPNGWPG